MSKPTIVAVKLEHVQQYCETKLNCTPQDVLSITRPEKLRCWRFNPGEVIFLRPKNIKSLSTREIVALERLYNLAISRVGHKNLKTVRI